MRNAAPFLNKAPMTDETLMHYGKTATWDRILRFLLALAMLALGWGGPEVLVGLRVLALYPLFTALVGWCPAYALLRMSTWHDTRGNDQER